MTGKDFDKIFRDKLSQHETLVEDGMWSSIESELDGVVKGGSRPAFLKYRRFIGYAASVAAVFFIALLLSKPHKQIEPEYQPYIHQEDTGLIAILDESPSEPKNNLFEKQPIESTSTVGGRLTEKLSYGADKMMALVSGNEEPENPVQIMTDSTSVEDSVINTAEDVATDGGFAFIGSGQYEPGGYMEDLGSGNKKYTFSLFSNIVPNNVSVSPRYQNTMAASGISHSNTGLRSMEIISEARHSLPLNLGIQAQIKVNSYISIGAGISYTWLRSKYDGLINKKHHKIKQSLHYIGIPVNAYFTIVENGKLKVYANAGAAIEKGVKASYRITSYDGTSFTSSAKMDGFQYSANAGFGLEYRFSQPCGVYLEPNAVYFFDSKVPASIRTDQPLQLRAEIGFRIHLK